MMRRALLEPTENVLAQAEWAEERGLYSSGEPMHQSVALRFEADTRHFAHELEWGLATHAAYNWLKDQPFSAEAALFGSWTAIQQDDFKRSIEFCEEGRKANPQSPWLANNMAYSLGKMGEAGDAVIWLKRARAMNPDSRERAYLTATEGLIHFRLGQPFAGRACYEQAISRLVAMNLRDEATIAKIILAEEEVTARTEYALVALQRAAASVKTTSVRHVIARWDRLKELSRAVTDPFLHL